MSVKLFYGEEIYLKEARVKKIKKEFGNLINGINFIQIDENNVKEIISDIETPAFGYEKKLIIAKNTGLFKKEKKTAKGIEAELIEFSNKIADYIKYKIIPIVSSPKIGDFADLGLQYITLEDYNNGKLYNEAEMKSIAENNLKVLEKYIKIHEEGKDKFREIFKLS